VLAPVDALDEPQLPERAVAVEHLHPDVGSVIELGGQDARTLGLLGKSAVAEGLFEDAIPVLEAALELDPDQASIASLLDSVRERVAA